MTTGARVQFFYDYVSPNAHLARERLKVLSQKHGFEVDSVPIVLGGLFRAIGNTPPLEAIGDLKAKRDYFLDEFKRYAARYDIPIGDNPHFPFSTIRALRMRLAAEPLGLAEACDEALFQAAWVGGSNLADPNVLETALTEAGLPFADLMEASREESVKDALHANTQEAERLGVFGVPSFIAGGQLYFGKDNIHELMVDLGFA